MASKQRNLWLVLVVPVSLLLGFLSRSYDSAIVQAVGLLAIVVLIALYCWPFGKKQVAACRGQLSEHGKMVGAKRELRAQEKLETARASISSHRPLVEGVSRALGIEASGSWTRFSEAFFRRTSVDDGLQAAFGHAPRYAGFDWRDVESLEEFMHRVAGALNFQAPALTEQSNSVEASMRDFDGWLRERGCVLIVINTACDNYHCLVLHEEDAPGVVNVATPTGVSVNNVSRAA